MKYRRALTRYLLTALTITVVATFIVYGICYGRRETTRLQKMGRICNVGFYLDVWYTENNAFPEFCDINGKHILSWRACIINRRDLLNFDLSRPWNSIENQKLIDAIPNAEEKFSPEVSSKKATIIAVTGPGTLWTETNRGRVKDPKKYGDMILIIETTEPKNSWAEPGDDASPEDVVRMFLADPGLVKNSKQSIFSKEHWPKLFMTLNESYGSFGKIRDVEELKRRLVMARILLMTLVRCEKLQDGVDMVAQTSSCDGSSRSMNRRRMRTCS